MTSKTFGCLGNAASAIALACLSLKPEDLVLVTGEDDIVRVKDVYGR